MKKQTHLKNISVWLLVVMLAVTMMMPAAAFAQPAGPEGSAENAARMNDAQRGAEALAADPAAQTALDAVTDPAAQTASDVAVDPAAESTDSQATGQQAEPTESLPAAQAEQAEPEDPEDPAQPEDPPVPAFFSIYRVETTEEGVLQCYWYDALGVKEAEPQMDRYFIVKFDKGSKTDGTAVGKVGKSGTLYYFNKTGKGKRYTGWFKQSGKKYYFKSGIRFKGTKKVKKTWYVFNKKNGRLQRRIGDNVDKKVQPWTSRTRYLIVVKLREHKVRIYSGKKNRWTRNHTFKCTTGKPSTPTVRGTFSIGSKGLYFNTGKTLRCWYYTQFHGNYLFHSVLYDRSSRPIHVVNGRLGVSASHGCIRLALTNAKWIYNNIPRGTKVVIF